MSGWCCALNCRSNYANGYKAQVYKFPSDSAQNAAWTKAVPWKNLLPMKCTVSMATSSKKDRRLGLITEKSISTLQSLCTYTNASIKDITGVFNELHRSLSRRASAPSSSSRGPGRRSGDSALQGGSDDCESFDRPCSCKPGEDKCWLVSELEPWNRVLSRNCIQLQEHSWGELALQGYEFSESYVPGIRDVLVTSLLMHVILCQHRCVTHVQINQAVTNIDMVIFWHSLQSGGTGVRHFEFISSVCANPNLLQWMNVGMWSQSAVCLPVLQSLRVTRVLFDEEVAHTLGNYLLHTTTLKSITFHDVQAEAKTAAAFLGYLARNKTVTSLCLQEHFVMAQEGQALALVVQNHVALEDLQISGTDEQVPPAVLRAAVQSRSLKSLTVRMFEIRAEDIEEMSEALTRRPPSYSSVTRGAEKQPATPTSRMESLAFFGCTGSEPRLHAAYASLIGGVLLQLRINMCLLGEVFAVSAASQLRVDSRLRVLNLQHNGLPASSICALVQALEVNSTVHKLIFDIHDNHPAVELFTMFNVIEEINVSSRLHINWYKPHPSIISRGGRLCNESALFLELDVCTPEDLDIILAPLASGSNVISASIKCSSQLEDSVFQRLADAFSKTKSLRELHLLPDWPEGSLSTVLRSLENNRGIGILQIGNTTFKKRSAKALARLVEENRALNSIFVSLMEEGNGGLQQLRIVCRELKESVPRNLFLTNLEVSLQGTNRATDFTIMNVLRRNRVLVNQAVRFVKGSNDKKDALAFETVQYSRSFLYALYPKSDALEARAKQQIDEARRKLAFSYFIFAGVVKAKIVCRPHRKRKPRFDKLGRDVLAHICSYLSLTDVIDI